MTNTFSSVGGRTATNRLLPPPQRVQPLVLASLPALRSRRRPVLRPIAPTSAGPRTIRHAPTTVPEAAPHDHSASDAEPQPVHEGAAPSDAEATSGALLGSPGANRGAVRGGLAAVASATVPNENENGSADEHDGADGNNGADNIENAAETPRQPASPLVVRDRQEMADGSAADRALPFDYVTKPRRRWLWVPLLLAGIGGLIALVFLYGDDEPDPSPNPTTSVAGPSSADATIATQSTDAVSPTDAVTPTDASTATSSTAAATTSSTTDPISPPTSLSAADLANAILAGLGVDGTTPPDTTEVPSPEAIANAITNALAG